MNKIFISGVTFLVFCFTTIQAQSLPYVVLSTVSDTSDGYYQAARSLADYRNAQLVFFNANETDSLEPVLRGLSPRYVAVVCRPGELDINFIRQFMMMSTRLDADPFSDFAYGYITGATAQDAQAFVAGILQAESQHIENYPLNVGGYVATTLNLVYMGTGGYMEYLNPPVSSCIWLETNDNGAGEAFFETNATHMQNKKLLDIGHNGDAHMLWLFEGGNTNPNPPVWNYDSTKIEDTAYARAGLSSYNIAPLNLYPAVAFNGACHSGETKRVMVEGDIAATFGNTQGLVKFYTMSDTFSFALSILKTGITGYFAPCGANNANDQGEDVYNAFLYHEPLGDVHKRSNDGVVMGFLGNSPQLRIYAEGESTYLSDVLPSGTFDPDDYSGAKYMLGGKANRIYFGDPLFNPYQNNHSDSLNITKATIDSVNASTIDISLSFNKPDGFWPVWDKFHFGDTRVYLPVELPGWFSDVAGFTVIDSSGPYHKTFYALEHFFGKTILHIEVDIPNDMYDPINYGITFRVTTASAGTYEAYEKYGQAVTVFPNPSASYTSFVFSNPGQMPHTLFITNMQSQTVMVMGPVTGEIIRTENTGLRPGLYLYRLINASGIAGQGKFIVK